MESKLAVTLILSLLLASWISDCEGFAGPFPTAGKRLLQKRGVLLQESKAVKNVKNASRLLQTKSGNQHENIENVN